jgi:hypothetical protein
VSRFSIRHRPLTLLLDFVFFAWLSYVIVAGRIMPDEVVSLFRNDTPAIAVTEPDPMFIPNPSMPAEHLQHPVA